VAILLNLVKTTRGEVHHLAGDWFLEHYSVYIFFNSGSNLATPWLCCQA